MATQGAVDETTQELPLEVQALNRRLAQLEATNREYQMTVKVLAVVSERLLALTGGDTIVITDEEFVNSPSLEAGREEPLKQVWIRISR